MFLPDPPDRLFRFLDQQPPATVTSVGDELIDHAWALKLELVRCEEDNEQAVTLGYELKGQMPADADATARLLIDVLRRFAKPATEGGAP